MDRGSSAWAFSESYEVEVRSDSRTSFVAPRFARALEPSPRAPHRVGNTVVLYDLPLPSRTELEDDRGCAAFLANSTVDS